MNIQKKILLKIPTLKKIIAVPSGGETKFEKKSLGANLGMFISTKNIIVFCGHFLTVFHQFKPTVYCFPDWCFEESVGWNLPLQGVQYLRYPTPPNQSCCIAVALQLHCSCIASCPEAWTEKAVFSVLFIKYYTVYNTKILKMIES